MNSRSHIQNNHNETLYREGREIPHRVQIRGFPMGQWPPVQRQRTESLGPRAMKHPVGLNPTNFQPPLDVQTSNLINNLNRWHLQDIGDWLFTIERYLKKMARVCLLSEETKIDTAVDYCEMGHCQCT